MAQGQEEESGWGGTELGVAGQKRERGGVGKRYGRGRKEA